MLPLTRPALATVAIFLFLQNWNEFLFALTFITEGRMRTLPTGIYALLSSEFYGNYPILAASLVLFSVPGPGALLPLPAAVHRGADGRRAEAVTGSLNEERARLARQRVRARRAWPSPCPSRPPEGTP